MKRDFFCGWRRRIFATATSGLLSFTTLPDVSLARERDSFTCEQKLAQGIDEIVSRPQFARSHWGISIYNAATNRTIYDLNGDKFFIPASTVKLLTTAAALNELGEDFRIKTPIYAEGELPNLKTVRVLGKGDPTISRETLANLARQFKSLGINRIEKLIIEDSYFGDPPINPTWEWGDSYYYYGTAVNSIILNQNMARLTLFPQQVGQPIKLEWNDLNAANQWQVINKGITAHSGDDYSIVIDGFLGKPLLNIRGQLPQNKQKDVWDLAILDPANYFLETFLSLLNREGIEVVRGIVKKEAIKSDLDAPISERIITQMYSPPLAELIIETNRESNNFYAEILLKILAKQLNYEDPIDALEQSLNNLGISNEDYSLVDGSGLSRHNSIAPQVLNQILTIMQEDLNWNIYRDSLAIAGIDGTLKNRLQNTNVQGYLFGKTGSLSGVITFAGYLKRVDIVGLSITIVVNNFNDKNKIARQGIDEIILLTSNLKNCWQ